MLCVCVLPLVLFIEEEKKGDSFRFFGMYCLPLSFILLLLLVLRRVCLPSNSSYS